MTPKDELVSFKFLRDIQYEEGSSSGKYFEAQWLKHNNDFNECTHIQNNISVFLLGNIYTNNLYKRIKGHQEKLIASDILSLYKQYGLELPKYTKGIYVLFIFDEMQNQFHVISSRSGLYDIYYHISNDFLILSSSSEFIIKNSGFNTILDSTSMLQTHIYDYPLGNRTLFKDLSLLEPGSILTYDLEQLVKTEYFNYRDSLNSINTISWQETWEQVPHVFNNVLDLLVSKNNNICSAITSGFDSRTNLSRLENLDKNVLYYSWGMPGSIELKIPKEISCKIGINYAPIPLNEDFEATYDYYAKQAIFWSDGRGTNRRANHTYSYSELSKHSNYVLTGLIGSELIRPTNAVDHIFNQDFVDTFYSEDPLRIINAQLKQFKKQRILKNNWIRIAEEEYLTETNDYFESYHSINEKYKQLYYFALIEGFRKYFGHEIHGCRMYNFIMTPYIDDDFVDFLLSTPIPALNIKAFQRNPKTLRLGQMFYLPVLKKNKPELLRIRTGRFYKPSDLSSITYPLSILPGYFRKYLKQRIKPNDTFNTHKWNTSFQNENSDLLSLDSRVFEPLNLELIRHLKDTEVSKYLSIRLYLQYMDIIE